MGFDSVSAYEPIMQNVHTPNSAFICGSQGSGKSYTLSCILENCLLPDRATGRLEQPSTYTTAQNIEDHD